MRARERNYNEICIKIHIARLYLFRSILKIYNFIARFIYII